MTKGRILRYMENIKLEDIINYSFKEGININIEDAKILYEYIKDNSEEIINNPLKAIDNVKVNNYIHSKLLELYNKYKFLLDKIK